MSARAAPSADARGGPQIQAKLALAIRPSWSRRPLTRGDRRALRTGLLFISPWLLGFLAFYLYPALASLYYSFTDLQILHGATWVGAANYERLLADPLFWKSLANSLFLIALGVPLSVLTALGVALLLNTSEIRGIGFFRTIFFVPVVVPPVAAAILWIWLLNPQYGLVNEGLSAIGIQGPQWFYDPAWSKYGIVLMMVWAAGDAVVIYLGALQGVSRSLYEAAEVDGAGSWAKLRNVTLPMISPAILFNLITGAIAAFQYFTQAFVVSEGAIGHGTGAIGGVQNSLLFFGLNLYNNAFRYFRMGYASALAWILLLIILASTLVMLRLAQGRVHYEGER